MTRRTVGRISSGGRLSNDKLVQRDAIGLDLEDGSLGPA